MNIIRIALRKPIAIMVVVAAIAIFSLNTVKKIKVDIFPEVELPAMYIAIPYGGLSPAYMDGFMSNEFQKVLLFVNGVQNIDFKSVQGLTLMKLTFYSGTDMSQAASEVSTQVNRAMGFLPAGAVPPVVVRFDGSSLPVGQLVFESDKRSITELQTMVLTKIRPMFVEIPGITAPAPFGGNVRSILVNIDPQSMQAHNLNPEEITLAITRNSLPSPAGNIRIGDMNYMAPINSIAKGPEEFLKTPIKTAGGRTVFVGDVATVIDGADQTTGYAMVQGKRSVYLPIIKKTDASTLDAVENLKSSMSKLQDQLPDDVSIKYEFDQSKYIERSLSNLIHEGILGAIFTGIMILLFLGDLRGALIVVLTIPIAILTAVCVLYLSGYSINIMTLSGLALSIGILVDEATVTIENIHQHMEFGKGKQKAILDALLEISTAKLLILLCILAVLTPSFMMTGIPRDMFLPLSMAVAFAMITSFIASQTFVPILANWLMKHKHVKKEDKRTFFDRFRLGYVLGLKKWQSRTFVLTSIYIGAAGVLIFLLLRTVGTDVMPTSNSGDFQIRIQAPTGSRLEKTESLVKTVIDKAKKNLPDDALRISSAYIGMHPSSTPINSIFLFTNSTSEAVLQLSVNQELFTGNMEDLKEQLRSTVAHELPEVKLTFEPMELTEKIMGQGAMTPIEIKVGSAQLKTAEQHANKIISGLKEVPFLRDVRIAEALDYPILNINVDRNLLSQFGLTMEDLTRSLVTATSSSRFSNKNLWIDPVSGLVFQSQVQIPENIVQSETMLRSIPIKQGSMRPILEDVAKIERAVAPVQVNRKGPNRYLTISANLYKKDLGSASTAVKKAITQAGEPPKGTLVWTEGTLKLLDDTLGSLLGGLAAAVIAIYLMLSAYYQSFKIPIVILSVVPAVIAGSLLLLFSTGSTLNLQSYMGIIMSIGVSVSNAVLLVNQAEQIRKSGVKDALLSSRSAAASRLRPILMTAAAMLAGMVPMALGIGEGSEQVAPLGRAVIGGLLASTFTILLIVPHLFSSMMKKATIVSPSLDPEDQHSKYYTLNKER